MGLGIHWRYLSCSRVGLSKRSKEGYKFCSTEPEKNASKLTCSNRIVYPKREGGQQYATLGIGRTSTSTHDEYNANQR